jgi:hypothetical protein
LKKFVAKAEVVMRHFYLRAVQVGWYIVLARKIAPEWVVEGDIKSCFDEIAHE